MTAAKNKHTDVTAEGIVDRLVNSFKIAVEAVAIWTTDKGEPVVINMDFPLKPEDRDNPWFNRYLAGNLPFTPALGLNQDQRFDLIIPSQKDWDPVPEGDKQQAKDPENGATLILLRKGLPDILGFVGSARQCVNQNAESSRNISGLLGEKYISTENLRQKPQTLSHLLATPGESLSVVVKVISVKEYNERLTQRQDPLADEIHYWQTNLTNRANAVEQKISQVLNLDKIQKAERERSVLQAALKTINTAFLENKETKEIKTGFGTLSVKSGYYILEETQEKDFFAKTNSLSVRFQEENLNPQAVIDTVNQYQHYGIDEVLLDSGQLLVFFTDHKSAKQVVGALKTNLRSVGNMYYNEEPSLSIHKRFESREQLQGYLQSKIDAISIPKEQLRSTSEKNELEQQRDAYLQMSQFLESQRLSL